jgi:hypothetical protein
MAVGAVILFIAMVDDLVRVIRNQEVVTGGPGDEHYVKAIE